MRELNTHESELVSGGLPKVPGACAPANLMTGAGIGALGMGVPGLFAGGPVRRICGSHLRRKLRSSGSGRELLCRTAGGQQMKRGFSVRRWFSPAQSFWAYTWRVGILWFGTWMFMFHCLSDVVFGSSPTMDRLFRFFLIAESTGLVAGMLGWPLLRMFSGCNGAPPARIAKAGMPSPLKLAQAPSTRSPTRRRRALPVSRPGRSIRLLSREPSHVPLQARFDARPTDRPMGASRVRAFRCLAERRRKTAHRLPGTPKAPARVLFLSRIFLANPLLEQRAMKNCRDPRS